MSDGLPHPSSGHAADAAAAIAELDRLLRNDAPGIADSLPTTFADATERYVALLLEANDRLNLTRVVEPAEVARLHLLDALSALPAIDAGGPRRVLDLGSGGGIPGIVLALARPAIDWTLVDSVRKKAETLRAMTAALGLAQVTILPERVELVGRDPAHREGYDLVTARACAPLPVLAEYAIPLLRRGGRLLAWKGPSADAELEPGARASSSLGGDEPVTIETGIPALGGHRLVVVTKVGATPDRYPRRPGEPSRHPLA